MKELLGIILIMLPFIGATTLIFYLCGVKYAITYILIVIGTAASVVSGGLLLGL